MIGELCIGTGVLLDGDAVDDRIALRRTGRVLDDQRRDPLPVSCHRGYAVQAFSNLGQFSARIELAGHSEELATLHRHPADAVQCAFFEIDRRIEREEAAATEKEMAAC
jgi:hypothetical protein